MENENLERDIEAIEKEKQEYLENNSEESSEDSEEVEVEETEFNLSEEEINEWLGKLITLKETKEPIELDIDDETTLKINYSDDSEEDELKSDEVIE